MVAAFARFGKGSSWVSDTRYNMHQPSKCPENSLQRPGAWQAVVRMPADEVAN